MGINSTNKYVRIRISLIGLPVFTILLVYMLFKFLLPDYFVQPKELTVDSSFIKDVFKTQYRYQGKDKKCIDIILIDKPYFIRLSDGLIDNYWPLINNTSNISKKIEVRFQNRLLQGSILNNPNQISIDNKIILPYNAKQSFIGWFALAIALCIVASLYMIYKLFKIYKANLYKGDKRIAQKSKWKLFLVWLTE